MKDFSSLLSRITSALKSDELFKVSVLEAVRECTGGQLSEGNITMKGGVLYLSTTPSLKSEIRLKEENVLRCIREKSGKTIAKIVYC